MSIGDIRVGDIPSYNMTATLYTKQLDERTIQCLASKDREVGLEIYNATLSGSECDQENCTTTRITCASLTIGDIGEYILPTRYPNTMEKTTLKRELNVRYIGVWFVSGVMCIELQMIFSKDVSRFYLHDDTKLLLYNKQGTSMSPIMFTNEVCVSTISNYIHELPHAVWKDSSFLCTSDKVSYSSGLLLVKGTLNYVTITRSGYRLKGSKRITYKTHTPKKTSLPMQTYCDLDEVRNKCDQCRISCGAAINGSGYLYCKNGWTYISHTDRGHKPIFIPFMNEKNNSLFYVTPEDDTSHGVFMRNYVPWVLACIVGLILLITCIIELYLGCSCLKK